MISSGNPACEKPCAGAPDTSALRFIVVTGGPGAGKTAVLELLRKTLCQHVVILPEAASILLGGGFWRGSSLSARRHLQKSIYHIQNELQEMARDEQRWALALCDRGTLDGAAYWPSGGQNFFEALQTDRVAEYAKYFAVVHLSSPAAGRGYNHVNPLRTESALESAAIDEQIAQVWKDHPNYTRINSRKNFIDKADEAAHLIKTFLPESCRTE